MIPNEKNYARDTSIKKKKKRKLPFFIRETENQLSIKGKPKMAADTKTKLYIVSAKTWKTDLKKH